MSTKSDNPNRRQFMRLVGTTTLGAGVAYHGGTQYAGSPVQNGQAIAPAVAYGAAVVGASVGSAVLGWALREYEVVGSNPPAEGLTADAAADDARTTARTRKSTNASTFIDNQNILDGIDNSAYADGKIAAIDALNDQKSESEVLDAAHAAVDDYHTTIQKNLLRTWNESVREFETIYTMLKDHEDIDEGDVFRHDSRPTSYFEFLGTTTHTLPDGSEMDLVRLYVHENNSDNQYDSDSTFTPISSSGGRKSGDTLNDPKVVAYDSGKQFEYLAYQEWNPLYTDIEERFSNVSDGLETWVSNVYGDVQSGTLDTSELLTPREQAELTTDQEDFPQALADLQALNISVDLEREAEVYLPDLDATIYGQLGYTGDTELEVGTVDPDATDGDDEPIYPGSFYFTYDVSRGEGTWGQYEEGIDGGELTFTAEPYVDTRYRVQTAAGETVDLTADDFTDNGDGTWTVDLSDQLDNAITNVDEIKFYSQTDETQYETIRLKQTFEIKSFTDSEGNQYQSSDFERSEPQDDTNYITEEEWKAQQERHEELIEKYEESQEPAGGGGIDLGQFDMFGLPGELVAGGVAVVVGFFTLK